MGVSRRHFLATIAAAPTLAWATPRLPWDDDFGQRLAALEAAHGGRVVAGGHRGFAERRERQAGVGVRFLHHG